MSTIVVETEDSPTDEELAERLRQVADLVEEGYSEGIRSEWAWSRTG